MVLTEDTRDSLVTGICLDDCFKVAVELCKYGGGEEALSELVEGCLLGLSSRERNVLSQLDQWSCFCTVVDNESTVVVGKAKE